MAAHTVPCVWSWGRRLWAEAGRGALGAGAGHGQLLRVDEWRAESHGSPFTTIIITVTPLSKLRKQYLLGINMLKWYLKNQALRS